MDDKDKDISSLEPLKIEPITNEELSKLISSLDITSINNINVDDTITLPSYDSMNYNYTFNGTSGSYGTITIGATGSNGPSSLYTTSGLNGTSWSNITSATPGLHVSGAAEFEGDVKIKGVSILETLQKIEKRLSILRPDPEKLAHFEALKKAYEHYKTLEALCELPTEDKE